LVGRITNSIRPVAVASLLAKGEAQDARVPIMGCGETRAVSSEEKNQSVLQRQQEVVGGRTTGRFNAVSRDRLARPDAVFMLNRPKSRAGQNDRASVVAMKRVTLVEPRDAGKMEA
jgi:hypothetical protein